MDNRSNLVMPVRRALRRGGVPSEEIAEFTKEATASDYHHLLLTCFQWVEAS